MRAFALLLFAGLSLWLLLHYLGWGIAVFCAFCFTWYLIAGHMAERAEKNITEFENKHRL